MSEFHTRVLTLPSGTVVRTVLRESEMELSDEQILERYPFMTEIAARWERKETS